MIDTDKIEDLVNAYNSQFSALQDNMKGELNTIFASVFKEYPNVVAFNWAQYTPYFNDGDKCEFSVNSVYVKFDNTDADDGDYEDGFLSEWDCDDKADKVIVNKIQSIIELIPADFMEGIFGDHCKITVTKNGNNIDILTEDHEHE